jgi:hypothetical protein
LLPRFTKDTIAVATSRLYADIYHARLGGCWCVICGWCGHSMRYCSSRQLGSGVIANLFATARKLSIVDGLGQSGIGKAWMVNRKQSSGHQNTWSISRNRPAYGG